MIDPDSVPDKTRGFKPIAAGDAQVLILGSLPSAASVAAGEYYAHPQNGFWPIMRALFGADGDYADRAATLIANKVAVWDVLEASIRPGSLDADIDEATAETNDFEAFFEAHPQIGMLAFNGKTAERLFVRRVLAELRYACPAMRVLPSTSPAYAAMSLPDKTRHWRCILDMLKGDIK